MSSRSSLLKRDSFGNLVGAATSTASASNMGGSALNAFRQMSRRRATVSGSDALGFNKGSLKAQMERLKELNAAALASSSLSDVLSGR